MSTAIKHTVSDRVKPSSGHSDVQGWASECPDVKNYKWRLNPVWHRTLYSCTPTVAIYGNSGRRRVNHLPLRTSYRRLSYASLSTQYSFQSA